VDALMVHIINFMTDWLISSHENISNEAETVVLFCTWYQY